MNDLVMAGDPQNLVDLTVVHSLDDLLGGHFRQVGFADQPIADVPGRGVSEIGRAQPDRPLDFLRLARKQV